MLKKLNMFLFKPYIISPLPNQVRGFQFVHTPSTHTKKSESPHTVKVELVFHVEIQNFFGRVSYVQMKHCLQQKQPQRLQPVLYKVAIPSPRLSADLENRTRHVLLLQSATTELNLTTYLWYDLLSSIYNWDENPVTLSL